MTNGKSRYRLWNRCALAPVSVMPPTIRRDERRGANPARRRRDPRRDRPRVDRSGDGPDQEQQLHDRRPVLGMDGPRGGRRRDRPDRVGDAGPQPRLSPQAERWVNSSRIAASSTRIWASSDSTPGLGAPDGDAAGSFDATAGGASGTRMLARMLA